MNWSRRGIAGTSLSFELPRALQINGERITRWVQGGKQGPLIPDVLKDVTWVTRRMNLRYGPRAKPVGKPPAVRASLESRTAEVAHQVFETLRGLNARLRLVRIGRIAAVTRVTQGLLDGPKHAQRAGAAQQQPGG